MSNGVHIEGGIVWVVARGDQDEETALGTIRLVEEAVTAAALERFACLVDIRAVGALRRPAMRIYAQAPGRPEVTRVAYLVASMPVMIGLGLLMELGRLGNKARAFRDESAALAWLADAPGSTA